MKALQQLHDGIIPSDSIEGIGGGGGGFGRCPVCWAWKHKCRCGFLRNYNFGDSHFGEALRIAEDHHKKSFQRGSTDGDLRRATDMISADGSIRIALRIQEVGHHLINSMTMRYYPAEKSEFHKIKRDGYADQYLIITVNKKGIYYWVLVDLNVWRWLFTLHGDELLDDESCCQHHDQEQPFWSFNLLRMRELAGGSGLIITNLPQRHQLSFKF
jgi:hypothetical protein